MSDLPPPPQQPWGEPGAGPYQAPGSTPPPYGQPGYGPPGPTQPPVNGLAIASLITAIAGIPVMLFCFLGWIPWIIALVLGVVALGQIKRSEGRQSGRGIALGGVITSAACLVLSILVGLFLVIFVWAVAEDVCSDDLDGDGFDECEDRDDRDPDVGEDFEFGDPTTTSTPR